MRKILITGSVGILLLLAGLYTFRTDIIGTLRAYRGEQLYGNAQAAMARSDWEMAAKQGVAAHFQQPERGDIMVLIGQAQMEMRNGESVAWWERALENGGDLDIAQLQRVIRLLLGNNQVERVQPFLLRLVQKDGGSETTRDLWMRSLMQRNEFRLAQRLDNWWNDEMGEIEVSEEGQRTLVRKMEAEEGDISRDAALELILTDGLTAELHRRAEVVIGEARDLRERLIVILGRYKIGNLSAEGLREEIAGQLGAVEGEDLGTLMNWANWMGEGLGEWVLEQVGEAGWIERGGELWQYWAGLAVNGMWESLAASVEGTAAQQVDTPGLRLYYRGLAQNNMDLQQVGMGNIALSVRTASVNELPVLERQLILGQHHAALAELYRREVDLDATDQVALRKLISLHYYLGNQEELDLLTRDLDIAAYDDVPNFKAFLIYLRMLFGRAAEGDTRLLARMYAEMPEFWDYRMLLGFSFYLSGNAEKARAFMEGVPDIAEGAPRHFRFIAALLLEDPFYLTVDERERLLVRERFLLRLMRERAGGV